MLLAVPELRGVGRGEAVAVKRFVNAVTPPVLVSVGRRVERAVRARSKSSEWEARPHGWSPDGPSAGAGWNVENVVTAYRTKLPEFQESVNGAGALGVATSAALPVGEPNLVEQNTLLVFAYALSLASRRSDHVSVLDWGGGLGFFSLLSRALLPDDVAIDFHCKELPLVCRAGREVFPDVTYWDDDRCLDRRYDLVLASSSLQYAEHWTEIARRLARATQRYLLLTRVPVVFDRPSFVVLQRIHAREIDTEAQCWIVNRDELVDATTTDGTVALVREFLLGGAQRSRARVPQDAARAYLFRATAR
jgi:putative methyltransferase (TIGR04325 family)